MGDIDDLDQAHHREPPGMGDATDPAGQEGPRPAAERPSARAVTTRSAAPGTVTTATDRSARRPPSIDGPTADRNDSL